MLSTYSMIDPGMLLRGGSDSPLSRVWSTPDQESAFHHFGYSVDNYDGLPHSHGEYCLVICITGPIEVIRPTGRDVIQAGEMLMVNPGEVHRCRFGMQGPRSEGLTLILTRRTMRQLLKFMSWPDCRLGEDLWFSGKASDREVVNTASKLATELQQQRPGYPVMMELLTRELLVHLIRSWPGNLVMTTQVDLSPQLPWIQMHRAMEYMNLDGKGSFRLSVLCSRVGVSPSRFTPLFKNSVGMSPHVYYNSLLVYKARRMLQHEHCSTKEVALTLGFKSVSHFCALFHQMSGVTPQAGPLLSQTSLPGLPPEWD